MSNSRPLGCMHGHQLQRLVAFQRLMFAGFERGVRQEGGQIASFLACGEVAAAFLLHEVLAALISSSRLSRRSWPSFRRGSAGAGRIFSMTCSIISAAADCRYRDAIPRPAG